MVDLNDYLKLNSNAIVGLVNKKYVPAEMTKEPTFEALRLNGYVKPAYDPKNDPMLIGKEDHHT